MPAASGPASRSGTSRRPEANGETLPRVEAMVCERLVAQLDAVWQHRLGLVVAPPGAGKSTLLACYAAEVDAPVAWYRADRWDAPEAAFVRRLGSALTGLVDGAGSTWSSLDDAIAALDALTLPRLLLVIDDLHTLEGSPAEAAIERLVERGPACLHVLAASRVRPHMNLSRLGLSGDLLELTAEDLRLRAWEVEHLFRDFYREPMAPEDLARLARWTEGWAAGLQLFHLATRGRPPDERRHILSSLGPRSRLARDYLAQNALARVRPELRGFLVGTSVLGRLSGPLCDRLQGRTGSEGLLEELEQRCLFTSRSQRDGTYRYHEVFRAYLQGVLISEVGEAQARARFVEAAELLLADGSPAEALEAYVRAEDWPAVEQILETEGQEIASEPLRLLSLEAQRSLKEDAWLGLAGARRLRAEGRFAAAVDAYSLVARQRRTEAAAEAARRERTALLTWLDADAIRPPDPPDAWWATLREGLGRDPRSVALRAGSDIDATSRLIASVCFLAAGEVRIARSELDEVAEQPDAEGLIACIAQLGRGAAALLAGDANGVIDLSGAIGAAEGLGWEWLARVGRSMLALSGRPDHLREAARLEQAADSLEDRWGLALARLARSWGIMAASAAGPGRLVIHGDASTLAARAADDFSSLGAPVLQVWATALAALAAATSRTEATPRFVASAQALGRGTLTEVPQSLVQLAEARWDGDERLGMALVEQLREGHGLRAPVAEVRASIELGPDLAETSEVDSEGIGVPGPPAVLHLLGQFRFEIGGEMVDLTAIRPRVRSLLHLLALNAGTAVHREVIIEALWPGADRSAAPRNLHVAVASLRRVLEPQASRGSFRLIMRDGEGYLLSLPPGSQVDVIGFEQAIAEARSARSSGDDQAVERWNRAALDRYSGDLLSEEGPADWVVARRELLQAQAMEAANTLARVLLDGGDHIAAASVCADALAYDRYHDPLWRMLIEAREISGDRAAARAARSGYRRALVELGVGPSPPSLPGVEG